jgi:hypothetical protein
MATGQIWVPVDTAVHSGILHECHDADVARHPGRDCTVELVWRDFWWRAVREDVIEYVAGCDQCHTRKRGGGSRRVRPWI